MTCGVESVNEIISGGVSLGEDVMLNFGENGELFSYVENGIELQILGGNCYNFVDKNVENDGVFSSMWVHVEFITDYSFNGNLIRYPQTSGPLIFPNTFPFGDKCPDNGETGVDINCSDALDGGLNKV